MGKRKTPEAQLHISPRVRSKPPVKRQTIGLNSPVPPKGTNVNNQYR